MPFHIHRYILKKLGMDNRKVFIFSLCCAIAGGFIMSDWQSIGSDPCSDVKSPDLVTRELQDMSYNSHHILSREVQQSSRNYTALQLREACEALSTPDDRCHWNAVSLFTGQYCQTCRLVCRSMHRTLNFFQFCLGIALITISIPVSIASSTVIASDFVSLEMQVTALFYNH